MRLFIIKRMVSPKNRTVAYGVYDADSKKIGLYSKEDVKKVFASGVAVAGLIKRPNGEIAEARRNYNMTLVDKVDSSGKIIFGGTRIIVNVNGFCENSKYLVVDCDGNMDWLSHDELLEDLKNGKIIGAHKYKDNSIKLDPHVQRVYCDYQTEGGKSIVSPVEKILDFVR